jgi:uncharacterized protein (DUF1800 family)
LGIGNYSERDIQEAARAFVGWGIRYPLYERVGGADQRQKIADAIDHKYPLVAFSYTPDMCDRGMKTILGKTMDFTAEDVLRMLAYHPVTANRMIAKLWSFFAYENPEPAVVDKLVKVWNKNDLHIKPVLEAIARSPEFWSPKCVQAQVKSPVDYTIGVLRQFGAGEALLARRKPDAEPTESMIPAAGQELGVLSRLMKNQGLDMLYPPDVAGWHWGAAWITAATMLDRIRVHEMLFAARGKQGPLAKPLIDKLVETKDQKKSSDAVALLLDTMDVQLPSEKCKVLEEEIEGLGGPAKAFANPNQATTSLKRVCRILFAAPEFQMC